MLVSAGEGAVLKYNDHVLVTDHAWKGFIAGIYEFLETPDEIDDGECECRLNLIAFPDDLYIDGGHAIAWAIGQTSTSLYRRG